MQKNTFTQRGITQDDLVVLFSTETLTLTLNISFDKEGTYTKNFTYKSLAESNEHMHNDIRYFVESHERTFFKIESGNAEDILNGEEDSFSSIAQDAKSEFKKFFLKLIKK